MQKEVREAKLEDIRKLFSSGDITKYSIRDLVKILDVSKSTANNLLNEVNITRPSTR